MKIEFSPVKMKCQHPTTINECWIEFHETHIRYKADFYAHEANSDDESMPWQEHHIDVLLLIKKIHIIGIEQGINNANKYPLHYVALIIEAAEDVKIYFKTKSKADELFAFAEQYLLSC